MQNAAMTIKFYLLKCVQALEFFLFTVQKTNMFYETKHNVFSNSKKLITVWHTCNLRMNYSSINNIVYDNFV